MQGIYKPEEDTRGRRVSIEEYRRWYEDVSISFLGAGTGWRGGGASSVSQGRRTQGDKPPFEGTMRMSNFMPKWLHTIHRHSVNPQLPPRPPPPVPQSKSLDHHTVSEPDQAKLRDSGGVPTQPPHSFQPASHSSSSVPLSSPSTSYSPLPKLTFQQFHQLKQFFYHEFRQQFIQPGPMFQTPSQPPQQSVTPVMEPQSSPTPGAPVQPPMHRPRIADSQEPGANSKAS